MKCVVIAVLAASASLVHTLSRGFMSWCLMQQNTRVRMSLGREAKRGESGIRPSLLLEKDGPAAPDISRLCLLACF